MVFGACHGHGVLCLSWAWCFVLVNRYGVLCLSWAQCFVLVNRHGVLCLSSKQNLLHVIMMYKLYAL